MSRQTVRPATGEIFVNNNGNLWVKDALSLRWRRTLPRAAQETGVDRIAQIPARKLRAAFATMVTRLGVSEYLLKPYLGHSPGDILGNHYRRVDLEDLRIIADRMDGWRSPATASASWRHSQDLFDSRLMGNH